MLCCICGNVALAVVQSWYVAAGLEAEAEDGGRR